MLIMIVPVGAVYASEVIDSEVVKSITATDSIGITDSISVSVSSNNTNTNYGSLLIPFIENVGQEDSTVKFYADTFAGRVLLTDENLTYVLNSDSESYLIQEFLDFGIITNFEGLNQQETEINYFFGNDPDKWHTEIPSYEGVSLGTVWPGVDVSLYAYGNNVEKIFTVNPGFNPSTIQLSFNGISNLQLNENGDLVLYSLEEINSSILSMSAPIAYQEIDGERVSVVVNYEIIDNETYGFIVGEYDESYPLTIDPVLQATYLGGPKVDRDPEMAIDFSNSDLTGEEYVFVAMRSQSDTIDDFPTTDFAPSNSKIGGTWNVVIFKLSNDLQTVHAATYFGTVNNDSWPSVAIDQSDGSVYVMGETNHKRENKAGTKYFQLAGVDALSAMQNRTTTGTLSHNGDVFIAKFNNDLDSIIRTTYYGNQTGYEEAMGVRLDPSNGDVFIVGMTNATGLPNIAGGIQTENLGGQTDESLNRYNATIYMAKLSNDLTTIYQSTFIGSSSDDGSPSFRIHPTNDHIYLEAATNGTDWLSAQTTGTMHHPFTGIPTDLDLGAAERPRMNSDLIIAKITKDLTTITESRYLGGSGFDNWMNFEISPRDGNLYMTGETYSTDFPVTDGVVYDDHGIPGQSNTFVTVMDSDLSQPIIASTYIGIAFPNDPNDIALDAFDNIYVSGQRIAGSNFDNLVGGIYLGGEESGGDTDMYVIKLSSDLKTWIQTMYLGGTKYDNNPKITFDSAGHLFLASDTASDDFPGVQFGADSTHSSTVHGVDSQRDTIIVRVDDPAFLATLPEAPVLNTATPGNMSVLLAWTAAFEDGGSPIIDYLIEYSLENADVWTLFTHDSTETQSVVTGLSNNMAYDFQITTKTAVGNSTTSNILTTTPIGGVPSQPTGFNATLDSIEQVNLEWNVPNDIGDSAIIDYLVEYREYSSEFQYNPWNIWVHGSPATTTTITGLTTGTTYEFQVSAENNEGVGTPSEIITAIPFTVPDKPSPIQINPGDGEFFILWNEPFDGGSPVTHYYVESKLNSNSGGVGWTKDAVVITSFLHDATRNGTFTGYTNGVHYDFRVIAANLAGNSTAALNFNVIPVGGLPDAPINIGIKDFGKSFVEIEWEAPGDPGDSAIIDYLVQYRNENNFGWNTFTHESLDTIANVTELNNGVTYEFQVSAENDQGVGYPSDIVSETPFGIPDPPINVFATPYDELVLLSWRAPNDDGGFDIIDYDIEYSLANQNDWKPYSHDGTFPTEIVSNLLNEVSYDFRVIAITSQGSSEPSEVVSAAPNGIPLPDQSGGDDGCRDCTDPTFYYSKHKIIVENGFTYNDYSTDVMDRLVETPLLLTNVNQTNNMILKVFDNGGTDNIKWIDVAFGLPGIYHNFNNAEATIEILIRDHVIVETKINDPDNLIDFGTPTINVVDCGYLDEDCLQVTIPHAFRDKLVHSLVMISASDYEPNNKRHVVSEGIAVQGDSVNEVPSDTLYIQKYLGNTESEWVTIYLIDRSLDIWSTEDGIEFEATHGGGYKRITPLERDPSLAR